MQRTVYFWLIVVLGGLAVVLGLRWQRQPRPHEVEQAVASSTNLPARAVAESAREVASRVGAPVRQLKQHADHRLISFGQIDVTGTVKDQHGQPLANITVDFTVDQTGFYAPASKKGSMVTDAGGNFRISGHEGTAVAIYPKAEGYELVATNNRVIYSGFARNDPLHQLNAGTNRVLVMWKLAGAEQLVRLVKTFRFSPPDSTIRIDLVRGIAVSQGGDLVVSIERPAGVVSTTHRGLWAAEVSAVEGGLQKVEGMTSQYTFEAPTTGYVEKFRIEMNPNDREWSTSITGGAFIRSRGGQIHSKVGFSLGIDEQPDKGYWVDVRSLSNPNGSRNWEEQPGKVSLITR